MKCIRLAFFVRSIFAEYVYNYHEKTILCKLNTIKIMIKELFLNKTLTFRFQFFLHKP
jgi:hypothetical protein